MFLNMSLPRLSSLRSILALSLLNSGIIGGGGPVGFVDWCCGSCCSLTFVNSMLVRLDNGDRGALPFIMLPPELARPSPFSPRNLRNQPLERRALRSSIILPLLRLSGRIILPGTSVELLELASWPSLLSASAYAVLSRFRLKRRRILPGREDGVGEDGTSSAERLRPPCAAVARDGEMEESTLALDFLSMEDSSCGSSAMGDGRGGGIFVPSVREVNLKLRAGSSKGLPFAVTVVDPFVLAGIAATEDMWERRIEVLTQGRAARDGMMRSEDDQWATGPKKRSSLWRIGRIQMRCCRFFSDPVWKVSEYCMDKDASILFMRRRPSETCMRWAKTWTPFGRQYSVISMMEMGF